MACVFSLAGIAFDVGVGHRRPDRSRRGVAHAKAMPADAPVTPSGCRIKPARRSITADSGPGLAARWGVSVTPDGVHALVTSSGQVAQLESTDLEVYDGATGAPVVYRLMDSPDGECARRPASTAPTGA